MERSYGPVKSYVIGANTLLAQSIPIMEIVITVFVIVWLLLTMIRRDRKNMDRLGFKCVCGRGNYCYSADSTSVEPRVMCPACRLSLPRYNDEDSPIFRYLPRDEKKKWPEEISAPARREA